MSLTFPVVAEWVVLHGIKKVDTHPTDQSAFTHRSESAYWFVGDDLELGRFINITPAAAEHPLRLSLTFFARPGCDLVESIEIVRVGAGSVAWMGDASALAPADLQTLYVLLHPIATALSAALADNRRWRQADLVQAAGHDLRLLNLLEV